MNFLQEIKELSTEIAEAQSILSALGDATRQHVIVSMLRLGECAGVRVNDIAAASSLSRAAVSHHLGILRKAGIVKVRKDGTKNFYYFDADRPAFDALINMLNHAKDIMLSLPNRE